mmetsp:Transcript_37127/g.56971  ORF Transcript_37127/g.56971 Transcript_37127/m.56971 type:complete len:82 (-) Transcript_37127:1-246(-)
MPAPSYKTRENIMQGIKYLAPGDMNDQVTYQGDATRFSFNIANHENFKEGFALLQTPSLGKQDSSNFPALNPPSKSPKKKE